MKLNLRFSEEQISQILDQALVYQCACPAQVCRAILGLRELHQYQEDCLNRTETDTKVHQSIGKSASESHDVMEACLEQILELEGWDMSTLKMPESLRKLQEKLL